MINYTFQFERNDEGLFRNILSRLEPEEYCVIKDVHLIDENEPKYSDKQAIIEMEPEACLTFRLGMKALKIRRERSEEELAAEKELNERNTVKITVRMPPTTMGGPTA